MTEAVLFGRNVSIGCGGIIVPSQGVLLTINGIRFLKNYVLLVTFQLRAMPTTRPKTLCLKLIQTFFVACYRPPPLEPPPPPGPRVELNASPLSLSTPTTFPPFLQPGQEDSAASGTNIRGIPRISFSPAPPTQHSRPLRPPLYGGAGVSVEKGYFYVIKGFFTYSHSFETKTDNYMPSLIFLKSRNCF